ncbi:MAG: ABC transporter permease, partial [Butyricicoccus porcorum]
MIKRLRSITSSKGPAALAIVLLLAVWQLVSASGLVPGYMLPSPVQVVRAFVGEFGLLCENAVITLEEAFLGLALGVAIGFAFAVLMDAFSWLYRAFYPLLVISQTIPTVAIAPLLVLWFGYEMTPKIILIVIATF